MKERVLILYSIPGQAIIYVYLSQLILSANESNQQMNKPVPSQTQDLN